MRTPDITALRAGIDFAAVSQRVASVTGTAPAADSAAEDAGTRSVLPIGSTEQLPGARAYYYDTENKTYRLARGSVRGGSQTTEVKVFLTDAEQVKLGLNVTPGPPRPDLKRCSGCHTRLAVSKAGNPGPAYCSDACRYAHRPWQRLPTPAIQEAAELCPGVNSVDLLDREGRTIGQVLSMTGVPINDLKLAAVRWALG